LIAATTIPITTKTTMRIWVQIQNGDMSIGHRLRRSGGRGARGEPDVVGGRGACVARRGGRGACVARRRDPAG